MIIAFAGDWHGEQSYAYRAMKFAKKQGADILVHVGDFGIWHPYGYVKTINEYANNLDLPVYFVDGNHEDHPWLLSQPIADDGFRPLGDTLFHIPRAHRWEWGGLSFMGLGGATSVDRKRRKPGIEWFPEEAITTGDMYRAVDGGHVDVLVTHDCPSGVDIPGITDSTSSWIPKDDLQAAHAHRDLLRVVFDQVTPDYLFHGHYHVRYTSVFNNCIINGLDCDHKPIRINIQVVDTEAMPSVYC